MAHLVHIPLRRRLKSVLLLCGFALFVIMAVLTAHQASDPKLSGGRHIAARPNVVAAVPAAAVSGGVAAAQEPVRAPPTAEPSSPVPAPVSAPTVPPQAETDDAQSGDLQRALALAASLRAVMDQSVPAATNR